VAEQLALVTACGQHCSSRVPGRDDDPRSALTREQRLARSDGDSASWACSAHDGEIVQVAKLLKWAAPG
jgi:hypothetical protein